MKTRRMKLALSRHGSVLGVTMLDEMCRREEGGLSVDEHELIGDGLSPPVLPPCLLILHPSLSLLVSSANVCKVVQAQGQSVAVAQAGLIQVQHDSDVPR